MLRAAAVLVASAGAAHPDELTDALAGGRFEESLVEFKQLLVEAHRARLLTLCRLDLVEAADPYDVRRSRTLYWDVEFNLIVID